MTTSQAPAATEPFVHVFSNPADIEAVRGQRLGPGEWIAVTQQRIDAFASATEDFYWIHCDPERAAREAPGGKTIAHGYLTLSLLAPQMNQIVRFEPARLLNVGANKVRFISPVPVASRLRLWLTVRETEATAAGIRVICDVTFEIEGQERPAMIAEVILLWAA